MAYANGQIPDGALVPISGRAGARLLAGPAASWERVVAECRRRYGWAPASSGPNDAYRSLAVQVATFLDRYVPARTGGGFYGDVRWWNGVRYVRKKGTAAAAVPGTSNHGKGRANDVAGLGGFGATRYVQFASVAVPLGWSNAEGRSVNEPWHWVDLSSPDLTSSGHASWPTAPTPANPVLPATPISPLTSEEDDMKDIIIAICLDTLGRLPEPSLASFWITRVATGEYTWKQVRDGIAGGPESERFAALGSEDARNARRNSAPGVAGWIA